MKKKVKVGVIGASGYSGEELVRLLLNHPEVELTIATSRQSAGKTIAQVLPKLASHPVAKAQRFTDSDVQLVAQKAEVVFLALPHGVAAEFAVPLLDLGCKVVDLSADFRLKSAETYREFYNHDHPAPALLAKSVYGMPELYRSEISKAQLVASAGCYPTSILLPVVPLIKSRLIRADSIIADSLSGVSGAGKKAEVDYLFAECNESVRPYGVPKHRHLSEIEQEISNAAGTPVIVQFTPHLIPVNRGILTTLYIAPSKHLRTEQEISAYSEEVEKAFRTAYANEPFIRLLEGKSLPDTKNVVGSNCLEIGWRLDARTGRLIVMSAIDNIVKGASGQAVQCMNLMCNISETVGLF